MGWGRKNQRRGQPGNAGQFAPDTRGKTNTPTSSAAPDTPAAPLTDGERATKYAARHEQAAARVLFRALPDDTLIAPDPGTPTLLSAARKVITSPDRYDQQTRRDISRCVTDLELAAGEHVAARVSSDTLVDVPSVDTLRGTRATARAACMMHADRARNALDTLGVAWAGEADDDELISRARAYLEGRDTALAPRSVANEDTELRTAITHYERNMDVIVCMERNIPH